MGARWPTTQLLRSKNHLPDDMQAGYFGDSRMSASASVVANWGTVYVEMRHMKKVCGNRSTCGLHLAKVRQTGVPCHNEGLGVQMTDQPDLPQGEARSERQPTSVWLSI